MEKRRTTPSRQRKSGAALFWAIVMATIAMTLMTGFVTFNSGNQKLAARLLSSYRDDLANFAVIEQLKPQIAAAMESWQNGQDSEALLLDGTPFVVREADRDWKVQVQDVEGLIDPYLVADDLLHQLPVFGGLVQRREAMLSQLPPGGRYEPLELTLRSLDLPPEFAHLFTQSSSFGYPRATTAPRDLVAMIGGLVPGFRDGEQVRTVVITISRSE
jgi:hypothetical protein